jgi:hypothetical protein
MAGNKDTLRQCDCCGSWIPGRVNYQNNIPIPIIERILPNGAEARCLVAITYKAFQCERDPLRQTFAKISMYSLKRGGCWNDLNEKQLWHKIKGRLSKSSPNLFQIGSLELDIWMVRQID